MNRKLQNCQNQKHRKNNSGNKKIVHIIVHILYITNLIKLLLHDIIYYILWKNRATIALIIGEDELKNNLIQVKLIRKDGSQTEVKDKDILSFVKQNI